MTAATRTAPDLYAITDRRVVAAADLVAAVDVACAAGLRWIQVREKDLGAAELAALVRRVLVVARARGARVLVNERADVALAAGADGVHLGETSLAVADVRRAFPALLVGASAHSPARARAAADAGADFVLFGPVFATPSKAAFGPPLGLAALAGAARAVAVPVVAVGGITPGDVARCVGAGARGVAAIRGVFAAADVSGAVAAYLQALALTGPGPHATAELCAPGEGGAVGP